VIVAFWVAVGLIAYTLAGFPLLVLLRGALMHHPVQSGEETPTVSVVVAAHNEVDQIGQRLENLLSLDYPPGQLQIIVASDGSDDGTPAVAAAVARRGGGARVAVLDLPRVGKAAALNAAVEKAAGEVLVMTDANSVFSEQAIRALVRPLADPRVGGVAGDQRYAANPSEAGIARGERSYWDFDRLLKEAESRAGNVISATGAIYAIRRSLFVPVRPDVTDDFYESTGVIEQGKRLVFAPDAVAFEPVSTATGAEFGRKVRIMTRGLRGVLARRRLLNPFRYGFYAVQLASHKLLRRQMALPLMLLLGSSIALWGRGPAFAALAIAQAALYAAGALGIALQGTVIGRNPLLAIPAFFCLVSAASVVATWNVIRGRRIERWQPRRSGSVTRSAS